MAETQRTRFIQTSRKVKVYGGRGQLYSWLRSNYEEIEELRVVHRNLWAELALDMVEDGVILATEGRYLRNRVWQIWKRVKRDVAAEAAAAKPKKVAASHVSPDWRPTIVPPPPPGWGAHPTAASPGALVPVQLAGALAPIRRTPVVIADMTPEGQAELDRLDAEIDAEDRKRFRFGGG
jgi:hypothetical protein